jgi:hypothetical protein
MSWDENEELLREKIQGTASALLGLVGIEADPLKSREHILLSNIFEHCWRRDEDLDLARLIKMIQSPPMRQLGVFDIDTFFPEKDRFELAMALNNIIAAPGFKTWLQGDSLDIAHLLYDSAGKPRHSIFYIAHLSEQERMFFVTLLLEQIITWVRQQSGTTSLRALMYFDEVFGFFPPVANPPSKRPLLTLLKQARAFGFGVVLTTQNPVDIDYKGLTNAGTWFIGKLQTDRDKMRVLDGLESVTREAGSALDRQGLDRLISSLSSRVFILHNVHEPEPVVFHTRWAMSYLRGPLTRKQVKTLMADVQPEVETVPVSVSEKPRKVAGLEAKPATGYASNRPSLSPGLPQTFLPVRVTAESAEGSLEGKIGQLPDKAERTIVYEPQLLALGRLQFVNRKLRISQNTGKGFLVHASALGAVTKWQSGEPLELAPGDLEDQPVPDAVFGKVPAELNSVKELKTYAKDFSNYLYREESLKIYFSPLLKVYGEPGESEREFKQRLQLSAREKRDADVGKLRRKYQKKLDRLETRLMREQQELTHDQSEYQARKREEVISAGESVISILGVFGRSRRSTTFSRAARKRRMTTRAKAKVDESVREIARLQAQIEELRAEMNEDVSALTEKWTSSLEEIETQTIKPRRADVQVEMVALAWAPYWEIGYRSARGSIAYERIPAWVKM